MAGLCEGCQIAGYGDGVSYVCSDFTGSKTKWKSFGAVCLCISKKIGEIKFQNPADYYKNRNRLFF